MLGAGGMLLDSGMYAGGENVRVRCNSTELMPNISTWHFWTWLLA